MTISQPGSDTRLPTTLTREGDMFTQWLLHRHLEQGHSIRDISRMAGVPETELQALLTNGHCPRSSREQLENCLASPVAMHPGQKVGYVC